MKITEGIFGSLTFLFMFSFIILSSNFSFLPLFVHRSVDIMVINWDHFMSLQKINFQAAPVVSYFTHNWSFSLLKYVINQVWKNSFFLVVWIHNFKELVLKSTPQSLNPYFSPCLKKASNLHIFLLSYCTMCLWKNIFIFICNGFCK